MKMQTQRSRASLALLAAILNGCTLAPGGQQFTRSVDTAVDTAVNDVQHFNDKMAETIPKLNCAVTIGAYGRMDEGDVKTGLGLMCGLLHTSQPTIQKGGDTVASSPPSPP